MRGSVLAAVPIFIALEACSANDFVVQAPSPPLLPTSYAECAELGRRWTALESDVSRQHQGCLDSHQGASRGKNCSVAQCETLHQLLSSLASGDKGALRRRQLEDCRAAVAAHIEQQARDKGVASRLEDVRQRDLDDVKQHFRERQEALERYREDLLNKGTVRGPSVADELAKTAGEVKETIEKYLELAEEAKKYGGDFSRVMGRLLPAMAFFETLFLSSRETNPYEKFWEARENQIALNRIEAEVAEIQQRDVEFRQHLDVVAQEQGYRSFADYMARARTELSDPSRRPQLVAPPSGSRPRPPADLDAITERCWKQGGSGEAMAACVDRELQNRR